MRHIVKVCGMREPDNIRAVVALGIDLMGFIFWPKSSRYVERMDSTPGSSAAEIARLIPTIPCKRVGVFVDEDIETVRRIAADYALDYIQLHGSESPDYLRALREACSVYGCATAAPLLIKAFNIATAEDLEQTAPYAGLADLFLFDTRTPSKAMGGSHLPGGTGQKFDWSVLSDYNGDTDFLLSGGIGPDDAEALTSLLIPADAPTRSLSPLSTLHSPLSSTHFLGIDLNSRFEIAPGLKDVDKLREFLKRIR